MRPLALLLAFATAACAQPARTLDADAWCDRDTWHGDRPHACEVREAMTAADRVDLHVLNGSVTVKAWDRTDVLVRSRVTASAPTQARADRLVRETTVTVDGGVVRAELSRDDDSWSSVSHEVYAPRGTDFELNATNGPVSVYDHDGTIRVSATNGPIHATNLSGDVRLEATNGPVDVELDGPTWRGAGLAVQAHNGPVTLGVPRDYSARVRASTEMGRISTEGVRLDETSRDRGRYTGDALEGQLGRGGPTLSLEAVNGPVRLRPTG